MRNFPFKQLVFGSTALLLPLSAQADPAPQSQMSFTQGASSTWNADWNGASHRAYFFQWSLDLATWQFAPFMEFGTEIKSRGIATENAPRFFVRLIHYDDPDLETLEQAKNADFDGDGLSNFSEVSTYGTSPLKADTDGDGLNDKWELLNGLNPLSLDSDGDGITDDLDGVDDDLTNLFEQSIGSNPAKSYTLGVVSSTTPLELYLPTE